MHPRTRYNYSGISGWGESQWTRMLAKEEPSWNQWCNCTGPIREWPQGQQHLLSRISGKLMVSLWSWKKKKAWLILTPSSSHVPRLDLLSVPAASALPDKTLWCFYWIFVMWDRLVSKFLLSQRSPAFLLQNRFSVLAGSLDGAISQGALPCPGGQVGAEYKLRRSDSLCRVCGQSRCLFFSDDGFSGFSFVSSIMSFR